MMGSLNFKVVVIDTETTGIDPYSDEILQLSIINGTGRALFNKYMKPTHTDSWPKAQLINHISPKKVSKCKTIDQYLTKIQKIIDSADYIVGYNLKKFDIPFLESAGIVFGSQQIVDVFLDIRGYFPKWPKLAEAALCAGYVFTPHDALDDCKATLHIFNSWYTAEIKRQSKKAGDNKQEQEQKVKEARKINRLGKVSNFFKSVIFLLLGTLGFVLFSSYMQTYLPVYFGSMRGLFAGMMIAGLCCYLFGGMIGPISGAAGAAVYYSTFEPNYLGGLFTLQILLTLLALRLLFWMSKRHKNIIIRFLFNSLAILISVFAVYHMAGSYLLSNQTSVSIQEWRNVTYDNSIWIIIFMETGLPFYMFFSKLFEKVV